MPVPIKASAELIKKEKISDIIFEFTFRMVNPSILDFIAGQYIAIHIDQITRRQYSISSSPFQSKSEFSLVVDTSPMGVGSNYLLGLAIGSIISFVGQIGLFRLPNILERRLYFIGTGTGIGPLKSMVETLILNKDYPNHEINVIFGTRHKENILYENKFRQYLDKGYLKDYKIYLSDKSPHEYEPGYVTRYLENLDAEKFQDAQFFICGNKNMIIDCQTLLTSKGVSSTHIFSEKFF